MLWLLALGRLRGAQGVYTAVQISPCTCLDRIWLTAGLGAYRWVLSPIYGGSPTMANDATLTAPPRQRRFTRETRPDIPLPNGTKLKPRARVADELGVSERTIRRMNAETTFVGNVAYVNPDSVLQRIADTLKRRNQPPARRRRS
jgi:hypothetical protein